ncbi:hypothetical protein BpHYR1_047258 [Brachionus plicatilis]|uniref:Uncharacterized protein n=1 Tax=Brachionus plicatilis TaxID=10195 RepID=A0A3M7QWQ5_BRAPC|nr:hypothetical protein BpHYR1_047258 [Brachionus plicatilis]
MTTVVSLYSRNGGLMTKPISIKKFAFFFLLNLGFDKHVQVVVFLTNNFPIQNHVN